MAIFGRFSNIINLLYRYKIFIAKLLNLTTHQDKLLFKTTSYIAKILKWLKIDFEASIILNIIVKLCNYKNYINIRFSKYKLIKNQSLKSFIVIIIILNNKFYILIIKIALKRFSG